MDIRSRRRGRDSVGTSARRYLARVGDATPLVAAVTVAGCLDFLRTADFVARTKHATYRRVFLRGMRRCVLRHAKHDPNMDGPEHCRRVLAFAARGPAAERLS